MLTFEKDYAQLVSDIINAGHLKTGRNGKTLSLFGTQLKMDTLERGEFPLLNGREMFYKGVLGEFAAFLNKPKSLNDFEAQGCNYWEKWAKPDRSINIDYGNEWVAHNQLQDVIDNIKKDPHSRRHIVNAWRHEHIEDLDLPCCHYAYQWRVRNNKLDMIWIQRSVDTMIGLPADIILAATFNVLMADLTGYHPGTITFQMGDTHIYEEHLMGALQYLKQYAEVQDLPSPTYQHFISQWERYTDFKPNDITIPNYAPMPPIKFLLKE